jgi:hypothetical protein
MTMSEDEYQHKAFFEKKKAVTIKGENITVTFIPHPLFDESQEKKLFCEEVKTNKDDKAI